MRIGIDVRPLQGETQYRGIGKSLEYLLSTLSESFLGRHEYVFYLDPRLARPMVLKKFGDPKLVPVNSPKLGRKRYFRSVMSHFRPARPSHKDIDVFFQYDAELGVPTGVPTVTIFHDAIPMLFRDEAKLDHAAGLRRYKNLLAGSVYWKKYLRTLKQYGRSKKIIAISTASKQDFIKLIGSVDEKDITVIPHGVAGFNAAGEPSAHIVELTKRPYLLYVGGIDVRKNVKGLVETFYELKKTQPDLQLITVGKEFSLTERLADVGWFDALNSNKAFANDVIQPGYLSFDDLAYLYKHAGAFVLTSRYEGFGMMILEAFQAGCPVVAYNNSSIPEVAGDAALIVEDGASLTPAIRKLLQNTQLRKELIAKGEARAKLFTWHNTAVASLAVLESVVKQKR